jgi:YVTN family beta-propeller protein
MPNLRSVEFSLAIGIALGRFASALPAQDPGTAPAAPPTAPAAALERLIVLNKGEATASLIDPATRKEVALVEVGDGPHEVAVAPDGRTAVACNYGGQMPGSTLTVIDVAAARATKTFVLERAAGGAGDGASANDKRYLRPHGICFLPDGEHVLVTSEITRRLLRVHLPTATVTTAFATPQQQMHMVALAPGGARAFATAIKDGNLAVFDLSAQDKEPAAPRIVATGAGAEGLAVHAGGDIWVGNRADDTVSVVDGKTFAVAATVPTARLPIRVAMTPDGAHALVSCAEAGELQVFDAVKRELAHTVDLTGDSREVSPLPIGICVQPDGRFAWVACQRGEFLAVVDLSTWKMVDRVQARKGPDGMAWARMQPAPK